MSIIHESKIEAAFDYADSIPAAEAAGFDRDDIASMIRSAYRMADGLDEDNSDETEEAVFKSVAILTQVQSIIALAERSYPNPQLRTLTRKIDEAIAALHHFAAPLIS